MIKFIQQNTVPISYIIATTCIGYLVGYTGVGFATGVLTVCRDAHSVVYVPLVLQKKGS